MEFVVFPNLLLPKDDRYKLAEALEGAERGRKLTAGQKYLITQEMAEGEQGGFGGGMDGDADGIVWSAPAGSQMRAYFAMFLEFDEGRIVRQRNYEF